MEGTVEKIIAAAQDSVQNLEALTDDDLYQVLTLRVRAIEAEPNRSGDFSLQTPKLMGVSEDLVNFGRKFFNRLQHNAYELLCGKDDDYKDLRNQVNEALSSSITAATGVIAAALVSTIGLAPAIAAVIAAILLRLVGKTTLQATCALWTEKLPQPV
jgi:hypothetical protein